MLREVTQAMLAARLVAVAALVVLHLWLPNAAAGRLAMPLVAAAVLYALAVTLYGAPSPDRAERLARWGIAGDVGLLWIGMLLTIAPVDFVFLGFPLTVAAGLLSGYGGAAAVAAALVLSQLPVMPTSMFAPAEWVGWTLLTFGLLAAAGAGGTAGLRLGGRARLARALSRIEAAASDRGSVTAAADEILHAAAEHFAADSGALALFDPTTKRLDVIASHGADPSALAAAEHFAADSGALALFDPTTKRLDVIASHGADPSALAAGPEAGEAVAGWVAQGGRAVLLTPGSQFPLPVPSTQIRSSMCVAAAVGGRPVGVLILHRGATAPEFTKDDLDDAQLVAAAATAYLLRAQNERTLSAALTALAGGHAMVGYALTRDPVVLWPALLDLVRSLTAARSAVLALEHEETGNVEIVAARGLNGAAARTLLPPLIAAITMGETQRPDGAGTAASSAPMTCVPLLVGSRIIGALGVDVPDGGPFSGPLLAAVAAHIAAAVGTAQTAHRVADIGAAEERRRIAREMHDGLAQTLANALLQVDLSAMTAQSAPADLARELRELRSLLEQAIREMREFMAELRRTETAEDRLFLALERLAREMERRHHQAVTVRSTGDDGHLPPAVRHAVLAITRQALANVFGHARATTATVRADVTDEHCAVSITDNGIGFDVHAYRAGAGDGHHLGLPSMEERALLVGGRLAIESEPNRGTTVTVQVPLGVRHG